MMFHSHFVVVSILSNYVIGLLVTAATSNGGGGFTVQLIRRDSPKSPFKVHPTTLQSEVRAYKIENILKLSMGTPPVDIYGIVDTGSNFIWTQCAPCDGCYQQIYPLLNPSKSSTYHDISCESEQCHQLKTTACSPKNLCNYAYGYGDGSLTQGVLGKEAVTLTSTSGKQASLDIVFGCGQNDSGSFNDHVTGIIGLGRGNLSFVSQIASSFGSNSKSFSHCFTPLGTDPSIPSKMSFGDGSQVFGDGVVSTPLISRDIPWYFVTLEGISVRDKYLPYDSSGNVSEGNVFLDSGTPKTQVPQDLYIRLEAEVKKQIPLDPVVEDLEQLCHESEKNLDGPILIVHFEGADVVLTPMHIFSRTQGGFLCFAIHVSNSNSGFGIYGNFAQSNFLIGYDMENMMLSFKPTDCTKF